MSSGEQRLEAAAQGASTDSGERNAGASIDQDSTQLALPLSSGRHIMRAEELDHDGKASAEVLLQSAEEIRLDAPESTREPSFGQRLRDAREAKGLSRAEVAQRLKLPLRLIAQLEGDDYAGMDEGVYLRGYLSSYARMVGVPIVAAETVAVAHMRAAPLVATGKVSRSRYLFDRYSVSATYLILTALIVVPADGSPRMAGSSRTSRARPRSTVRRPRCRFRRHRRLTTRQARAMRARIHRPTRRRQHRPTHRQSQPLNRRGKNKCPSSRRWRRSPPRCRRRRYRRRKHRARTPRPARIRSH